MLIDHDTDDGHMHRAELAAVVPYPSLRRIERQLTALDVALDNDDLRTARHQVAELRRSLESTMPRGEAAVEPTARHLRLVGGVPLTSREVAALQLLTDGSMSQKDIARSMGVTTNTVKTHLKSLYLKLGAHCRGEAIQRARDFGILPSTIRSGDDVADARPIERAVLHG